MPALAILTVFGLALVGKSGQRAGIEHRRLVFTALCACGTGTWFLFVFSQTTNVNSGGTVHVSRYALWLIPLTLPAIATASRFIEERLPGVPLFGAIALFAAYLGYFQPAQPERYVEHSPQAVWFTTHLPDAYRPVPEVFVERTLHVDGGSRVSAADPSCRLMLVVATQPEQPCALTPFEQANLEARVARGDAAVWVRRQADGASRVEIAH
jgi:hypothetical protein